jgi:hypothetical protein
MFRGNSLKARAGTMPQEVLDAQSASVEAYKTEQESTLIEEYTQLKFLLLYQPSLPLFLLNRIGDE